MEECCKEPNFCAVCMNNGKTVIDNCCEDCRESEMPIRLPTVKYKGKEYYIDWRLQEFRPVEPPLEFIRFDSDLGREIDSVWN